MSNTTNMNNRTTREEIPNMTQEWQQPIREMEYKYMTQQTDSGWSEWIPVMFIRAIGTSGFEVMGSGGCVWPNSQIIIRTEREINRDRGVN